MEIVFLTKKGVQRFVFFFFFVIQNIILNMVEYIVGYKAGTNSGE